MYHLLALPPELLENIVADVDRREDVLSLALSCRYLHSLVPPSLLQYRDIRCRLGKSALWDHLASDDLHAGLLRSLTIMPDRCGISIDSGLRDNLPREERVPDEYREPTSDEATREPYRKPGMWATWQAEERLIHTLKRLPNLRRFRWFRTPADTVPNPGHSDVWETVNALGTVQELHVLDFAGKWSPWMLLAPAGDPSSSLLFFPGLTSFNLKGYPFQGEEQRLPDATPLLHMLVDNCPDLQSLTLDLGMEIYARTVCADLLLRPPGWPNLHTLYLDWFHCTSSTLSTFLASHPSLKDIRLSRKMPGYDWTNVVLQDGALPNLRRLECSSHTAAALLKNPRAANGLVSLRGVNLEDELIVDKYFNPGRSDAWWIVHTNDRLDLKTWRASPWKAQLLEGIRLHPLITSVWLGTASSNVPKTHVMELATVAPQITELSLPHDPPNPLDESEWIDTLSHFPNLKYLRWCALIPLIRTFGHGRGRREAEQICAVDDSWRMAVIIDRNEDGQIKWVFRRKGDSLEHVLLEPDETIYTA
ncbi:hypothetical protein OE88DRAFT_1666271 [Heliocybe sulcata]|uniref:F-box domain-containing protein n=1 Tax=Heliocybe sulcata TaxID=5364 RepID=A0A5C3MRB0_9AGAM|nr:hypothetical protein OE88DRAFT_1666271 [Heliocybe sulcata]